MSALHIPATSLKHFREEGISIEIHSREAWTFVWGRMSSHFQNTGKAFEMKWHEGQVNYIKYSSTLDVVWSSTTPDNGMHPNIKRKTISYEEFIIHHCTFGAASVAPLQERREYEPTAEDYAQLSLLMTEVQKHETRLLGARDLLAKHKAKLGIK